LEIAMIAITPRNRREHGVTLLRVSLGAMWIAHALLKLFVFTLPGTAKYFESVGFAGWLAYPVFAAELQGDGAWAAKRSDGH
jgi:putative oxidoreductase